jgi:hypothetical protein
MKTIAQNVVEVFYREQVHPTFEFGHNSEDLQRAIASNVAELLNGSLFHAGLTHDANVSVINICLVSLTRLYSRAALTILATRPSLTFARTFTTVEGRTVSVYTSTKNLGRSRNLASRWH